MPQNATAGDDFLVEMNYVDVTQEVLMTKHTIELEIGDQTYAQLVSIAQANGVPLDDMLVEAVYRVIEDTQDMAAIAEYERQKAHGTLEMFSLEEVSARLGLDH